MMTFSGVTLVSLLAGVAVTSACASRPVPRLVPISVAAYSTWTLTGAAS